MIQEVFYIIKAFCLRILNLIDVAPWYFAHGFICVLFILALAENRA